MAKLKTPRIGEKMAEAAYYVWGHPGCAKLPAARFCAPNAETPTPGTRYGYRAVDRAMQAGLIEGELTGSRYSLSLTDKGRELMKARFGVTS